MNKRSFIILFAIVLVMITVLYSQRDDLQQQEQQLILPELSAVLNDVEHVTVIGAGDTTIATLDRGGQHWTLAERDGYRANVSRIRKNLIALAEARIVEPKTADPNLYTRLGVQDPASTAATGKKFILEAPSKSFELIIGNTGVRGKMAYVRRPDDEQAFLVTADLDPGEETLDWLRRELLDIDSSRMHSVTITHPDGEVLRIEKPAREAQSFVLVDMPEGRELQFPTVLDPLAGLLSGLTLDDVRAGDTGGTHDAPTTINSSVRTRFETYDGLVIEATVREAEEGPAVRFGVRADAALAERFATDDGSTGESPSKPSFATVSEETQRLNAELDGWVYTLPSAVTDALTQRLEDIVKPAENDTSS